MKLATPDVIAALEQTVAGHEDYVYPAALTNDACTYSNPDGTPSCIVGHVVFALDPEAFQNIVELETVNGESCGVADLASWGKRDDDPDEYLVSVEFDKLTQWALQMAQSAQDGCLTWGEAKEFFDRVLAVGIMDYDTISRIRVDLDEAVRARRTEPTEEDNS